MRILLILAAWDLFRKACLRVTIQNWQFGERCYYCNADITESDTDNIENHISNHGVPGWFNYKFPVCFKHITGLC